MYNKFKVTLHFIEVISNIFVSNFLKQYYYIVLQRCKYKYHILQK